MGLGIIVVCHGSSHPLYQKTFSGFLGECQAALSPWRLAGAQLEAGGIPLQEQILRLAELWQAELLDHLVLLPLFMGGGVHVEEDLPQCLTAVGQRQPDWRLQWTMPLGQSPVIRELIRHKIRSTHQDEQIPILVGHGSRSPTFASYAQDLRQHLHTEFGDTTMVWLTQSPRLADYLSDWHPSRPIRLLPLFLLPGGILDQIQLTCQQMMLERPGLTIHVDPALIPDPRVVMAVKQTVLAALPPLKSTTP
ncbi:MAG: CbiX/SirB N-terminal domain-containing protein [Cyanobacteriota bacterium]|nr:CbiX/SirB N-terminal domain-containing protein [Cyanobacteriota bacterium]